MSFHPELFLLFVPWLCFVCFGMFANKLILSAKKRTGLAIFLGAFVQMITPDPLVEKTIETITAEKVVSKKSHANNSDKP